ncbi:MAG: metalloregulator ArsR/SmtB family transcription factor [Rhizobium sp.]|nr:metalloregulator ArsR/SmtB family transcription factor [Rhizobium sp.]
MARTTQQVFQALAAAPRRAILQHLAASSLTAGEISSRFDMAKPSVSQHLTILETAGLISREKRGQYVHYTLVRETLDRVLSGFAEELGAAGPEGLPPEQTKPAKPADADKAKARPRKATTAETPAAEAETGEETPRPAPAQMSMF